MPESDSGSCIPSLFPDKLVDICLARVLDILTTTGTKVEKEAQRQTDSHTETSQFGSPYDDPSSPYSTPWGPSSPSSPSWLVPNSPWDKLDLVSNSHFTDNHSFIRYVEICRDFLATLLAGSVLDSLAESARQAASPSHPGHVFTFSVLCCDRLGRLVVHLHCEMNSSPQLAWAKFLNSSPGNQLILNCLGELSCLSSLYLHHLATNEMLYTVSNTCRRLTLLDISYSSSVTDIGLIHLCGMLSGTTRVLQPAPVGCKYLRELYFNPQGEGIDEQIMPKVIACLLRHLPLLQVVDLTNLHPGIDHYYRGANSSQSRDRYTRVKPLNLVHYTGSDKLAEVMDICPKLRTFKLFVTESLSELGTTLQSLSHSLDQVSLVYPPHHTELTGFQQFLTACGRKISRLDVECSSSTIIKPADLTSLATNCPQIESVSFTNFHVDTEVDPRVSHSPVPTVPANFPFLSNLRLANVTIEQHGKDVFRYLVGGAHDLETIFVSFASAGYFFSDFLIDDILLVNNLSHLQEFILKDGALTLISALRLISSRPKLRIVGRLLHWDVEPSELTTFIQILRKAKSLSLLQDITII